MLILGIETSCDETAASLLRVAPSKKGATFKILSNVISSQIPIHRQYGGIVPEVAARAHIEKILPVLKEALGTVPEGELSSIDLIAVTNGPGLITSLLVGMEVAKTLAYLWQKPLTPVNHLIAHIYANFLDCGLQTPDYRSLFPAICLVVSGGHTKLILMKDLEKFKEIGSTRDDAAGECFDKVAKLLGIGYPGGPEIAREAAKFQLPGCKSKIKLPRPMISSDDFDFSFSGLKTAVLYLTKKQKFSLINSKKGVIKKFKKIPQRVRSEKVKFIRALCAEVQQAIIDVLVAKTIRAARQFGAKSIILSGGVAANSELRKQLEFKIRGLGHKTNFLVPPKKLCTDNAAMIGAAGYFKIGNLTAKQLNNLIKNWKKIKANPNLGI